MVAIYLEELEELVEAFAESTQQLLENPQNKEAITIAERQLHTIKGGARMTGLPAIGDLSHAGESLLNLVGSDKVQAGEQLLSQLQIVSDELFRMYEQAAAGTEVQPASELIERLQQLSSGELDSAVAVAPVSFSDTIVGDESKVQDSGSLSTDDVITEEAEPVAATDPMVAIFLEELSELVEAFDATSQKLIDNPQDTEAVTEAERQLHTIKGGARMSGLMAIGDLSHAGESLLNLVANNKVSADGQLLEKLQQVSDTLYKMYEAAASGKAVVAVEGLINELHALCGKNKEITAPSSPVAKSSAATDTDKEANVAGVKAEVKSQGKAQNTTKTKAIEKASQAKPTTQVDPSAKVATTPVSTWHAPDFTQAARDLSVLEKALGQFANELNSASLLSAVTSAEAVKANEDIQSGSSIRVSTGLINQLITTTNEWGHQNIRLVEQYEENKKTINELKRTGSRLKEQIRNLELEADSSIHAGGPVSSLPKIKGSFDPLEMDEYTELQQQYRSLSESLEDLMSLTESLDTGLKNMGSTSESQEKICKQLQEGLITTRMTRVSGLLSRLKRIVRQVSVELGKQVKLEITDENCEMDRTILEKITASLEHLIRNSLAHGIEKPEQRKRVGKPPIGTITLDIRRDGSEIVITLQDDGAGIDVDKLRELSIKKGLISADAVLTDKEVYQLILMSGVSTADKISQVAGRGVGMDVVNAEVNALGGNIVIDSQRGKFTRFVLSVPYNLATNQVMLLDVSGEVLAIPVAKLEGMQRISVEDLNVAYARNSPLLELGDKFYVLRHLGETLGLGSRQQSDMQEQTFPVLLFQENGQRVAYQVDEIRGNREVMLKPLGAMFEESQLLSSASILGGGQIVLLLNAHELINLGMSGKTISSPKEQKVSAARKEVIMVVDDSITVRKITESLLLSLGYDVITANDGVTALEVLVDETPDLILLDIEMPRMDGFEFLENIRSTEQWRDLPVIMISSRSGAKHRQHAADLGANGFIGKPWEAEQLAADIRANLSGRVFMKSEEATA